MKLFVIHRFKDRRHAKSKLKQLAQGSSLEFQLVFLDSSGSSQWKQKAENAINEAEAVIVFNPKSCEESDNAKWEIEKAKDAEKEIIELYKESENKTAISRLKSLYELKDEFDNCFSPDNKDVFDLYKMMVDSSEQLIQRRQKTNAFFITAIGSMLAIAGLLTKTGAITGESIGILYAFSIVGLTSL